jgi:hypothetical protein
MTDRIDGFLERLDRLSVDDLEVLAIEPLPSTEHDRLLDEADAAATAAGRLDELDDAADLAHDSIVRSLSSRGYDPTWFGLNWGRTLTRVGDRAELILAVEDAAIAAVVADLAPDTADELAARFERLAGMRGSSWAENPEASDRRNPVRVLWVVAAIALASTTIAWLVELVAEYTPSHLFG